MSDDTDGIVGDGSDIIDKTDLLIQQLAKARAEFGVPQTGGKAAPSSSGAAPLPREVNFPTKAVGGTRDGDESSAGAMSRGGRRNCRDGRVNRAQHRGIVLGRDGSAGTP